MTGFDQDFDDPGAPPPPPPAPDEPGAPPPPPPSDPVDPELVDRAAELPLNDYGNGQRIVVYFGETLMFVPRLGWFVWTGSVWAQDNDLMAVRRLAHKIAARVTIEAEALKHPPQDQAWIASAYRNRGRLAELRDKGFKATDEEAAQRSQLEEEASRAARIRKAMAERRAKYHRHAKAAGNSGPIANMLRESEPYVTADLRDLNANHFAVNVANATLVFEEDPDAADDWDTFDRRSWRVRSQDHRREDLITKIMPVEYAPDATCPRFLAFLEEIQPSADMRAFLQRWFGYSLLGLTWEQKLVFFHGGGRNGKSTLVDLIAKIFGDYATSVPIETLTGSEQRKGSDATPDLVRLPGARMVRASEPEEGIRFKEAIIKLITGGEPIMVRRMREEFIEAVPIFKLTISGNHKPEVRGADDGIWRRILLVPFDQQIPPERVEKRLPELLWEERSGILNWLLDGARAFLRGGLAEPAEVIEATSEFRDDSDPIRKFLVDVCEITGDPGDFIASRDMVAAFGIYRRDQGQGEWTGQTVLKRLGQKAEVFRNPPDSPHVFTKKKTASHNGFAGLRFVPDMAERVFDRVRSTSRGDAGDGFE